MAKLYSQHVLNGKLCLLIQHRAGDIAIKQKKSKRFIY